MDEKEGGDQFQTTCYWPYIELCLPTTEGLMSERGIVEVDPLTVRIQVFKESCKNFPIEEATIEMYDLNVTRFAVNIHKMEGHGWSIRKRKGCDWR